jgi:hypothetical protein
MKDITFTIEPRKRLYYLHMENDKYCLLQDTGKVVNKHRVLIDTDLPLRKVFIKLSNVNILSNLERLVECYVTRLPIVNGYHIGKNHREETTDLLIRLNRI